MIRAEGERIAATADTLDREKIQTQLQSLAERWTELLDKAGARYVIIRIILIIIRIILFGGASQATQGHPTKKK